MTSTTPAIRKAPAKDCVQSTTTPVMIGDTLFASSITFGGMGLELSKGPEAKQLWVKPALTCYFSTPMAVGKEDLYLVTASLLDKSAMLRCIEASTGKELWNRPKVGTYHASLLRTGDDKLLMLEEPGNLVLLDPNPKEYKELARAKICGKTWAHAALANGRLYIRDDRNLVCVQLAE